MSRKQATEQTTKQKMQKQGYRVRRLLVPDPDNGGATLVWRWVLLKPDELIGQPGAHTGGAMTRQLAWDRATDVYDQTEDWALRA